LLLGKREYSSFLFLFVSKRGLPTGSSLEPSPGSNFRWAKEKEKIKFKKDYRKATTDVLSKKPHIGCGFLCVRLCFYIWIGFQSVFGGMYGENGTKPQGFGSLQFLPPGSFLWKREVKTEKIGQNPIRFCPKKL